MSIGWFISDWELGMVFQVEAMTSGPCIVQYPPCSSIHDKDSKPLPRCGEVCFFLSCNSNPDFDLLESIRGTADSLKSDNALLEAVRFITQEETDRPHNLSWCYWRSWCFRFAFEKWSWMVSSFGGYEFIQQKTLQTAYHTISHVCRNFSRESSPLSLRCIKAQKEYPLHISEHELLHLVFKL